MTRTSSMVDSSSRECSVAYGCPSVRVTWVPQHWSNEASTVQARPHAAQFLVVSVVEMWTAWLEFQNRSPGDSGNTNNLWMHTERGVRNHNKKMCKKMKACLAGNGWYERKYQEYGLWKWAWSKWRKCQEYGLWKWGWGEWINWCFRSFSLSFFWSDTGYTQLFSQSQLYLEIYLTYKHPRVLIGKVMHTVP